MYVTFIFDCRSDRETVTRTCALYLQQGKRETDGGATALDARQRDEGVWHLSSQNSEPAWFFFCFLLFCLFSLAT